MNLALPGVPSVLLYLLGAGLVLSRIREPAPPSRAWLAACIALAALLHAAVLVLVGREAGQYNLGFFHMLSAVAWLTVVLVMLGTLLRPMLNLGLVLFPLAALCIGLQLTLGADQSLWRSLHWQLNVHAALSVLAFAVLTVAAAPGPADPAPGPGPCAVRVKGGCCKTCRRWSGWNSFCSSSRAWASSC